MHKSEFRKIDIYDWFCGPWVTYVIFFWVLHKCRRRVFPVSLGKISSCLTSVSVVCLYSFWMSPRCVHTCSECIGAQVCSGMLLFIEAHTFSLNRILNCNHMCDTSAFVKEEGLLDFLDPPDPTHLSETLRMTVWRRPGGLSFIQHPLGETERFELNRTED